MNNPAIFLIASLLFRTSSSSKNPESSHGTKSTETELETNSNVAITLLKAFKSEDSTVRSTVKIYIEKSSILMPFEFPVFESYDMDLAARLSKMVGLTPQFIFSYLVRAIYELVQFHVRRFFKLGPSEPFVPIHQLADAQDWKNSPQGWFRILFGAIMPGVVLWSYTPSEPVILECLYVKQFMFLNPNDNMFACTNHVDEVPGPYVMQRRDETPAVVIYALPSSFFGKTLEANQIIIIEMKLERSYPHHKKILEYLLKGVTFAFDLKSSNLDVIVKPTKDIPSVEESMRALRELLEAPLERQIVVPEDVEKTLSNRTVPKLSCYHPANELLDSIELYERMMMLIVAGRAQEIFEFDPNFPLNEIVNELDIWLKLYLPGASVKGFIGNLSKSQLYTYLPYPPKMWIYKGEMDGQEIGILLKFGKPMMLSLNQMTHLKHKTYPFASNPLTFQNADTPIKKIIQVVEAELEKSMVVKPVKEPTLSTSKAELVAPKLDETVVVEQLGALAFYLSASKETVDVALQAFLRGPLGRSMTSFGTFRITAMPLSTPNNPQHISFPILYPMPSGKVFAVSLKTGKALRTKVPMMLHSTRKHDGKTYCRFIWFDTRSPSMAKGLPTTNELFEVIASK